ncbi:hypothetical protein [Streptomyces sp. AK08-02]|uniref:hypothetical protein n=1 Tax=Streptomyces sp. AK08-02 TaxID=3028654 RepID=UPI0029A3C8E2|nr:hypothetical protein [Streptomyces sp. AK08-02]MDX3747486.1 hypothetical protein [Streptomyces sp. AK08-02]
MTTLTTQAGFDTFRDGMCKQLAALPDGLGKQPLHVTQAELAPDTFCTHRLADDGHHLVYDPRQTTALMVRQFLGIYAHFTEDPIIERIRENYYNDEVEDGRKIWAILLDQIDRSQDPRGVVDQVMGMFSKARAEKAGATA